jgi:putative salt-induced outer membrane protein YdiY
MKKFLLIILIMSVAGSVSAAKKKKDAAPVEEALKGLKTTVSAGISLTDGNSDTLSANASITTEGEKEGLGSILAGFEANYGESTIDDVKEKTVENAKIYGSFKKTLSPRTYASLDGTALYDDIALIDYRVNLGPSVGTYLIKNDKSELSVDIGPSYLWEKVDSVTDDYLAIRFGERFTCQISETAKLWQSVEYLPEAEDFDRYLINAEIGVEATVTELITLRVVLQDKYTSTPATEKEYNDLTLIAGLGFTL